MTQCRPTVLIVDDDQGVAETFARLLRLEGFNVETAIDAERGLRQAQQARPAAIILDLRMPLVDGLTFLQRLREIDDQQATPVAVVTGDYFLEDSVAADIQQLGAAITFKPLWLEDLVDLVRTLVNDPRGRPESN